MLRIKAFEKLTVTCPSADDLGLAKIVAWRDKDIAWLKECSRMRIIAAGRMEAYAAGFRPSDLETRGLTLVDVLERISRVAS